MNIYYCINWVNTIGFAIAGIMLCKLVFIYQRPTYLDRYFYWSFIKIILGVLTQYYATKTYSTDWFLKAFPFAVWVASIIFCIDIKKVSFRIKLTAEERAERILNRSAIKKILLNIFKTNTK